VLAMVSVSVRPSALNFATSSGCSASETSSCVMTRLSSWRLARSYLLQSEPENTVTSIDHPPNPEPRDALDGLAGDLGGLRDLALGYVEVDGQVDNADMKAEQ
jgi:hypothetical protein